MLSRRDDPNDDVTELALRCAVFGLDSGEPAAPAVFVGGPIGNEDDDVAGKLKEESSVK